MTRTSITSLSKCLATTALASLMAALCALAIAPGRAHAVDDGVLVVSVTAPTSICSVSTYDGSLALPTEDAFYFRNNSDFSVSVTGWKTEDHSPFRGEATKDDAIASADPGSWWIQIRSNQGAWRTLSKSTTTSINPDFDSSWKMSRKGSVDPSNQNKPTDVLKIDSQGWVAANVSDGTTTPAGGSASLLSVGRVALDSLGGVSAAYATTDGLPLNNGTSVTGQRYAPMAGVSWNISPVKREITYDLNATDATWDDGTNDPHAISTYEGMTLVRPTDDFDADDYDDPTRTGYILAGWSEWANGINPDTSLSEYWGFGATGTEVAQDVTLYAQWLKEGEAWAAWSAPANTLYFIRSATDPTGSSIDGNMVTQSWGGMNPGEQFETSLAYTSSTDAPWSGIRSSVQEIAFKDPIAPSNTAWWFDDMPNCAAVTGLNSISLKGWGTASMASMFCGNAVSSLDLSGVDVSKVTDMSHMFAECWSLSALDISSWDTSSVTNMADMFGENVTWSGGCGLGDAAMDDVIKNLDTSSVTDMSYMFSGMGVTSLDLRGFDTSNVTNMEGVFTDCYALGSLNISSWDTSSVTNMCQMFGTCSALPNLDVRMLDTSNVVRMDWMFYGTLALSELDLSQFSTSSATTMEGMFCGTGVTSLDLYNFDTSNVTNMEQMFARCPNLTSLRVTSFDTSNVTTMDQMFFNCPYLTMLNISSFSTPNLVNAALMFGDTSNYSVVKPAKGVQMIALGSGWTQAGVPAAAKAKFPYFRRDVGDDPSTYVQKRWYKSPSMTLAGSTYSIGDIIPNSTGVYHTSAGTVANPAMSDYISCAYYKPTRTLYFECGKRSLSDLMLAASGDESTSTSSSQWIALHTTDTSSPRPPLYANRLTLNPVSGSTTDSMIFDGSGGYREPVWRKTLSGVNIRTDMRRVKFIKVMAGSSLRSLAYWFWDLPNLEEIDFSDAVSPGYATSMEAFCKDSPNLKSVKGMSFDTGNITTMKDAFNGCSLLDNVDVSLFDTSNVTTFENMFYGCSSLAELDISWWDTSSATTISGMFRDCASLREIKGMEALPLTNVTNMDRVFEGCDSLAIVNLDPGAWSGGSASNARWIFNDCDNMAILNLEGFCTPTGAMTSSLVDGCDQLVNLVLGTGWNNDNVGNQAVFPVGFTGADVWYDLIGDTTKVSGDVIPSGEGNWVNTSASLYGVLANDGTLLLVNAGSATAAESVVEFYGYSVPAGNSVELTNSYLAPGIDPVTNNPWEDMGWSGEVMKIECIGSLCLGAGSGLSGAYLFAGLENAKSFDCGSYYTSGTIADFSHMFSGCTSLESVDFSVWNTSNITDFSYMFDGCCSLEEIEWPSIPGGRFVTSSATNLYGMFRGCARLASVDEAMFDVSNVVNLGAMFEGCGSLGELDLTSWVTTGADNLGGMFSGCTGLEELQVGAGWGWSAVANADSAYLPKFPSNQFSADYTTYYNIDDVVPSGAAAAYYRIRPSWIVNGNTLEFKYASAVDRAAATTASGVLSPLGYVSKFDTPWSIYLATVDTVSFTGTRALQMPSLAYWFDGAVNVVDFDFTMLDESYVNDWTRTFAGVAASTSAISLDLSSWDITNANTLAGMFDGANIAEFTIGAGWHYKDSVYADTSLQPTFPDVSGYGNDSYHLNGSDSYYEATSSNCAHIPTVTGLPSLTLTYTRDTKPVGGTMFTMSLSPGVSPMLSAGAFAAPADGGGTSARLSTDAVDAVAEPVAASAFAEGADDPLAPEAIAAFTPVAQSSQTEPSWMYDSASARLTFTYATSAERGAADDAGVLALTGYASARELPWFDYLPEVREVVFCGELPIEPTSVAYWLEGAEQVVFIDFKALNVSSIADWTNAFRNCGAATAARKPDLRGLEPSIADTIMGLFADADADADAQASTAGVGAASVAPGAKADAMASADSASDAGSPADYASGAVAVAVDDLASGSDENVAGAETAVSDFPDFPDDAAASEMEGHPPEGLAAADAVAPADAAPPVSQVAA